MLNPKIFAQTLACAVIGALLAVGLSLTFLVNYRATAALDPFVASRLHDAALYRRSVNRAFSIGAFQQFARTQPASDAVAVLERRLGDTETRWLSLDYNYGVTKGDLRDLPEAVGREFGLQVIKDGISSGSTITAIDKNERVAGQMVDLLSRFMADLTLRSLLLDKTRNWAIDTRVDIGGLEASLVEARVKLESHERRLTSMGVLQSAGRGERQPLNVDSPVQVQVAGARYLSVAQQITAIQTEKIDMEEQLRQLQLSLDRALIRKRIGELLLPLAQSADLAEMNLKRMLSVYEAEKAKIVGTSGSPNMNSQLALADFQNFLAPMSVRYLEGRAEPPVVKREGPRLVLSGIIGALAGIGLSLLVAGLMAKRGQSLAALLRGI
jgi:hypothetical protein